MRISTTDGTASPTPEAPSGVRHRDAEATRQVLLHAARKRFAHDGYSSTTVRDIAADAGVNVALINRYFVSKEGLFEACLTTAARGLDQSDSGGRTVEGLLNAMIMHVAGPTSGELSLQLLLMLRSSGDAGADHIRGNALRGITQKLVIAAGWSLDDPDIDRVMLRAELALSTALGVVLLRSSTAGLEPLSSVGEAELSAPLREVFSLLLSSPGN
jgi:AcrR family transcriptional regulator